MNCSTFFVVSSLVNERSSCVDLSQDGCHADSCVSVFPGILGVNAAGDYSRCRQNVMPSDLDENKNLIKQISKRLANKSRSDIQDIVKVAIQTKKGHSHPEKDFDKKGDVHILRSDTKKNDKKLLRKAFNHGLDEGILDAKMLEKILKEALVKKISNLLQNKKRSYIQNIVKSVIDDKEKARDFDKKGDEQKHILSTNHKDNKKKKVYKAFCNGKFDSKMLEEIRNYAQLKILEELKEKERRQMHKGKQPKRLRKSNKTELKKSKHLRKQSQIEQANKIHLHGSDESLSKGVAHEDIKVQMSPEEMNFDQEIKQESDCMADKQEFEAVLAEIGRLENLCEDQKFETWLSTNQGAFTDISSKLQYSQQVLETLKKEEKKQDELRRIKYYEFFYRQEKKPEVPGRQQEKELDQISDEDRSTANTNSGPQQPLQDNEQIRRSKALRRSVQNKSSYHRPQTSSKRNVDAPVQKRQKNKDCCEDVCGNLFVWAWAIFLVFLLGLAKYFGGEEHGTSAMVVVLIVYCWITFGFCVVAYQRERDQLKKEKGLQIDYARIDAEKAALKRAANPQLVWRDELDNKWKQIHRDEEEINRDEKKLNKRGKNANGGRKQTDEEEIKNRRMKIYARRLALREEEKAWKSWEPKEKDQVR